MADQKSKQDDVLTTVARGVGTALAKVASAASRVGKKDSTSSTAKPRSRKAAPVKGRGASATTRTAKKKSASAPGAHRTQQKKKINRAKHKRSLGRKTAG